MYNDPNTGQFQWGNVIQDIIRNYFMMQAFGQGGQGGHPTDPASQAATVGPVGGMNSTMPPPQIQGRNPHDAMGMAQDPQLMQMLMQLLQMGR